MGIVANWGFSVSERESFGSPAISLVFSICYPFLAALDVTPADKARTHLTNWRFPAKLICHRESGKAMREHYACVLAAPSRIAGTLSGAGPKLRQINSKALQDKL
jgi:hypothetical protein